MRGVISLTRAAISSANAIGLMGAVDPAERPDPDAESTDPVRQCRNPACLTLFNSRESVINVIHCSDDREIITALVSRISVLSDTSREALL